MRSAAALRLLDQLSEVWAPFSAAVAALGEGRLERRTSAGWTAKELLAHTAFWDETVEGVVTLRFRGQRLPVGFAFGSGFVPPAEGWPHFEVHNAREAVWGREHSAAEVMQRAQIAHERLVGVLATISDEEAATHAEYFDNITGHYREHLPEIEGAVPRG